MIHIHQTTLNRTVTKCRNLFFQWPVSICLIQTIIDIQTHRKRNGQTDKHTNIIMAIYMYWGKVEGRLERERERENIHPLETSYSLSEASTVESSSC